MKAELETHLTDFRRDMQTGFARLETRIERRTADVIKWCYGYWAGSLVALLIALAVLGGFVR